MHELHVFDSLYETNYHNLDSDFDKVNASRVTGSPFIRLLRRVEGIETRVMSCERNSRFCPSRDTWEIATGIAPRQWGL